MTNPAANPVKDQARISHMRHLVETLHNLEARYATWDRQPSADSDPYAVSVHRLAVSSAVER